MDSQIIFSDMHDVEMSVSLDKSIPSRVDLVTFVMNDKINGDDKGISLEINEVKILSAFLKQWIKSTKNK